MSRMEHTRDTTPMSSTACTICAPYQSHLKSPGVGPYKPNIVYGISRGSPLRSYQRVNQSSVHLRSLPVKYVVMIISNGSAAAHRSRSVRHGAPTAADAGVAHTQRHTRRASRTRPRQGRHRASPSWHRQRPAAPPAWRRLQPASSGSASRRLGVSGRTCKARRAGPRSE